MKKSLIVIAVAVIALGVVGYLLFAGDSKRKFDFRFDQVSTGEIAVTVTATGTINAVTTVDVGTQVSGIISKLYADFNSIVKEGQVIAQIDPTFLQQSVKDAEANLQRATAQVEDSKRTFARIKTLLDMNLESQENYDAALTALESNQAGLKQAQATLDRAKINLSYATIYAPISGVVIDRKVNVGQTVAASFSSPTLYTIANDLRNMQVQTTVDESDIGKVSIGQQATFSVDAYPEEKFSGTVSQIRLAPVSIQNVVNYTVVIDVNNDQLRLMPGMTANVKILVASDQNVLRVPNMALRFQPPADMVDSTGFNAARAALAGRDSLKVGSEVAAARIGTDASGAGRELQTGPAVRQERYGGRRAASEGSSERFAALRDSIQAAHGGNLSREELRAEVYKASGRRQEAAEDFAPAQPGRSPQPDEGSKYGVIQSFPVYQKSAYIPTRDAGMGKVWIVNARGKLEPVFVNTGLTDGKYTEITSPALKAGDRIVIGATANGESGADQVRSPFAGQGQRPMGGRF